MSSQADDFIEALQGQRDISVTVRGRRTGRRISLPVWFILEGGALWLLPVTGAKTQWVRNLQADPTVTVHCRWQRFSGLAQVMRDPQRVQQVAEKFRVKYHADQVAKYYTALDTCVQVPLRSDR